MKLKSFLSDYVGILSAVLCMIHCLVGPFITGVTTHVHHHAHEGDHNIFLHPSWDYVFLLIGFFAVYYSARHSHQNFIKILLWASFLFLAGAIFFEGYHTVFQYLVYMASTLLISIHLYNIRQILKARKRSMELSDGTGEIPGTYGNVEMVSCTYVPQSVETH